MTKPKLLLLITELGYGGAERSMIRLANALQEEAEVRLVVFSEKSMPHGYSDGVEPIRCQVSELDNGSASLPIRWWRRWKKLRALKREHDMCISFLAGPNALNVLCGMRQKTVVSIRGSMLYDANLAHHHPFITQKLLLPMTLRGAGGIVAVSPGLRHEIRQLAGDAAAARVRVISPFFIEEEMQAACDAPLPEEYASLASQPYMVSVGRLSIEKHMHDLIAVFAGAAERVPGAKLVLVGSGSEEPALRNQVQEAGLAVDDLRPGRASVIFTGRQTNPLPFVKAARVFAFASNAEGFPNALIEALYAECLVVAADAPWGTRALLSDSTARVEAAEPYPTSEPTPVEYGILMPRIDMRAHHHHWSKLLSECLMSDAWQQRYRTVMRERAMAFDRAQVVPAWKALVKEKVAL